MYQSYLVEKNTKKDFLAEIERLLGVNADLEKQHDADDAVILKKNAAIDALKGNIVHLEHEVVAQEQRNARLEGVNAELAISNDQFQTERMRAQGTSFEDIERIIHKQYNTNMLVRGCRCPNCTNGSSDGYARRP